MSRFNYVLYDAQASSIQASFKGMVSVIEAAIERDIKSPRSKALALTALEEVYMWIGKAIRDDQIERNGATTLLESRSNS